MIAHMALDARDAECAGSVGCGRQGRALSCRVTAKRNVAATRFHLYSPLAFAGPLFVLGRLSFAQRRVRNFAFNGFNTLPAGIFDDLSNLQNL